MLGFFGIGQELLNIGEKQGFDAGGCRGLRTGMWIVTIKVVQIALSIYLATSGAAIAKPSEIEAPASVPWNERTKISNSDLKRIESGTKVGVNVVRPRGNVWVEGTKLGQDGGTEGGASRRATSVTLSPERKTMIGERGRENSDESYQCDGYCGLYLSLPIWIVAYWIALQPGKPNVRGKGRRAFAPSK